MMAAQAGRFRPKKSRPSNRVIADNGGLIRERPFSSIWRSPHEAFGGPSKQRNLRIYRICGVFTERMGHARSLPRSRKPAGHSDP